MSLGPGREGIEVFDVFKDGRDGLFKFLRDAIGEETVIADDAKLRDEDVLDKFEDEIFSGQTTEGFGLAAWLIEEGDELAVVVGDSGLS